MEIQPSRAITPSGTVFFRWGLRGGAVMGMIPLAVGVIASSGPVTTGLAVLSVLAIIGGAVAAIAAALIQRRPGSLGRIQRELRRARTMLEQRLIDEEDYRHLKDRVIEYYRPGPVQDVQVWPAVLWGAYLGIVLPSAIMCIANYPANVFLGIAGATALAGGLIIGGAAEARLKLIGAGPRDRLPAPQRGRRMLGE